jgi:hypothetical protein
MKAETLTLIIAGIFAATLMIATLIISKMETVDYAINHREELAYFAKHGGRR